MTGFAGWSSGGSGNGRAYRPDDVTHHCADSDRQARSRRDRGRGGSPGDSFRLGHSGTGGGGVRARVRRIRRRPSRLRGVELHDGAAPGAAGGRRWRRRRGHHGQLLVHRHGERGSLLQRNAGIRRHRPRHLQPRSGGDRTRDYGADESDSGRAPARHAVRSRPHPRNRPPPRHSGDRGRRVCHRERDRVERPVGEDRQTPERHRVLLVPPAQGRHHRRRRDADDRSTPSTTPSSVSGGSTA